MKISENRHLQKKMRLLSVVLKTEFHNHYSKDPERLIVLSNWGVQALRLTQIIKSPLEILTKTSDQCMCLNKMFSQPQHIHANTHTHTYIYTEFSCYKIWKWATSQAIFRSVSTHKWGKQFELKVRPIYFLNSQLLHWEHWTFSHHCR